MISINTNLSSLIVQNNLKSATNGLNKAIERMTTGFKINGAKDNAANYSISTNLTTKIGAFQVAEENASMGLDMLMTASSSLEQIDDKLVRLRALQEQASNGTYGDQSLRAINAEVNALVDEIERIYSTTSYNGIDLFRTFGTGGAAPIAAAINARGAGEQLGFIKEIIQRDTSSMTELTASTTTLTETTYKITNAAGLAQLANLVNSGVDTTGKVFVLANDIDLSGIDNWSPIGGYLADGESDLTAFTGTFDGNGYTVLNLNHVAEVDLVTGAGNMGSALFGAAYGATIKNVGVKDVDIEGFYAGSILGLGENVIIENCSTSGSVSTQYVAGGIAGQLVNSQVKYSYSSVNIAYCFSDISSAMGYNYYAGGVAALDDDVTTYNNCYYDGTIQLKNTGSTIAAGIGCAGNANKCYFAGIIENIPTAYDYVTAFPITSGTVTNSYYVNDTIPASLLSESAANFGLDVSALGTSSSRTTIESMLPTLNYTGSGGGGGTGSGSTGSGGTGGSGYAPGIISLQVGIGDSESSRINVNTAFVLNKVALLRNIGLDKTTDYLSEIDGMLTQISEKQTHLGAVSNRLESVLEEVMIQYENLVSTRSTIRDADIAEESSQYIKMQILQNASATLLATANQTPAIALQLI